jgi:hypothetical protein
VCIGTKPPGPYGNRFPGPQAISDSLNGEYCDMLGNRRFH